jgi:hypothetical protein
MPDITYTPPTDFELEYAELQEWTDDDEEYYPMVSQEHGMMGYAAAMAGVRMTSEPVAKPEYVPVLLERREGPELEEFPYAPGSTRETVYHHYSDGSTKSIQRYRAADGYTRITVFRLYKDGTVGTMIHVWDNA